MNKFKLLSALILLSFGLGACSEFLSKDITREKIVLNSPSDSLYTHNPLVSFWWDVNDDIEKYRLQVVAPDFNQPALVFDTLMLDNSLLIDFEEGVYTARVRGENEGSETGYVNRFFIIDETNPLAASATEGDGDSLMVGDTLSWLSRDVNFEHNPYEVISVQDSLYISRLEDSTQIFEERFFEFEESKQAALSVLEGKGNYWWWVVTFDRAGNRRQSRVFKFFLN